MMPVRKIKYTAFFTASLPPSNDSKWGALPPTARFPLQQIIMQQKVDQLCKWAFLQKWSNYSLQIEATRGLLRRRFPTDLCFLSIGLTCRHPAAQAVKRCFRHQRNNCRERRHQTDTVQAEISLTEDVSFYSAIYGGYYTLLCCLHVIFNKWPKNDVVEVERISPGSPFFLCILQV